MTYNIAFKSTKGRKKESHEFNGDYCEKIENENCIVLALADGVGSCVNDARAAQTVCNIFIEKCSQALKNSTRLDADTLDQFCKDIDPILAVDQYMACFCVAVWYTDTDQVIWLHVGDTRIYKYSKPKGFTQITEDDHGKAVNIKVNGKLYTDHGAVVSAVPICNAIGDRNCVFHTGTFDFFPGESVILCSDGMYNSSAFTADVIDLLDKADLDEAIKRIDTTDDDDASLFVLRRNAILEVDIPEIINHIDDYKKTTPIYTLSNRLSDELETLLTQGSDIGQIVMLTSFMKEHQLFPDKQRINDLYNDCFKMMDAMPQGEDRQQLHDACVDLKEVLRYVYTH